MRPWWEGQEEDDRTDVPLDIAGMTQEPWDFLERQEEHIERILKLVEHGLGVVHALTLLRVWTQGAGVHIIRLVQVTQCWAISVDNSAAWAVARLLMENPSGLAHRVAVPAPQVAQGGGPLPAASL